MPQIGGYLSKCQQMTDRIAPRNFLSLLGWLLTGFAGALAIAVLAISPGQRSVDGGRFGLCLRDCVSFSLGLVDGKGAYPR